jgi:RNase adaptor protein for sRNA GlmZ degradation
MRNLRFFILNKRVGIVTPEFDRLLQILIAPVMIDRFEPIQANEKTPLSIQINSFSYKQGLPVDDSGNGGGFVFDMRGITNPGRLETYRCQTGKDKPVIDYLEQQTRMTEFLNSVWDIIDIQVEAYLKRDFEHLQINFGCTGGQHRSVYAAEQTARHLRNKYKVRVEVNHRNQTRWVKE